MDNENERLREYDKKTCHLIKKFENRLSMFELEGIKARQYGGEWTLAVELMLAAIVHEKIQLSSDELHLLIDLGRELNAEEKFMTPVLAMQPVDGS